jgi:hypothetical protein
MENAKSAPAETVKLPEEKISQKNIEAVPHQHKNDSCCHH